MHSKLDKAAAGEQAVIRRAHRKRGGEEHGSSAWKVAFADFCLALLALFLVLWLLSAREQERLQELLRTPGSLFDDGAGLMRESLGGPRGSMIGREPMPSRGDRLARRGLASGEDDPAGPGHGIRLSKTVYESRQDMLELAGVLGRLGELSGLGTNVHSQITPHGLRVMLHDTDKRGVFERGSAVPTERFAQLLRHIGPLFAQIENQMVISGHTDALPYADRGPEGMSNWQLASARAMTARSHLLSGGMPAHSVLQVVGLADSAPLNEGDATAHENRRIELLILTREQARSIRAMFGPPGQTWTLVEGVDASVPDYEAFDTLRTQLTPDRHGS